MMEEIEKRSQACNGRMVTQTQCEQKTDEELVTLARNEAAYFGCLIDRYQGKLERYIFRITNVPSEEVQDILQESFIKAYVNINDFDTSLRFSSWMYRIVHNQVISTYRKNKVRPQGNSIDMEDEAFNNIASDLDVVQQIDQKLMRESMGRVLLSLDEKYREVLVLRFLEDKDYKEMSHILKKPMGTIATLLSRAKQQLKEELLEKCHKI